MDLKVLNLPSEEIYKDLFQPGMKKAGEALSTVLDVSNLILLPLKIINERSRMYLESNLKMYADKLNKKELIITQVPQYVGLPILEKMTYLEKNELAEAFLNLLTKASFEESANLAHPNFVTILNNLSVDEAKILFHLKDANDVPYIDIYIHKYIEDIPAPPDNGEKAKTSDDLKHMIEYAFQDRQDTYIDYSKNLTGLEKEIDLIFPGNINIYIENLVHNGIIYSYTETIKNSNLPRYEFLEKNLYRESYDTLAEILTSSREEFIEFQFDIDVQKKSFRFTEIGKAFLKACIIE